MGKRQIENNKILSHLLLFYTVIVENTMKHQKIPNFDDVMDTYLLALL